MLRPGWSPPGAAGVPGLRACMTPSCSAGVGAPAPILLASLIQVVGGRDIGALAVFSEARSAPPASRETPESGPGVLVPEHTQR